MNGKLFSVASLPVLMISIFVFLCGALSLVLPSGYTIGPVFLLLVALVYLFIRPYPSLNVQDKCLLSALLTYALVGIATNLIHHMSSRDYDNFSRFVFAIPVLLLLLRIRIAPVYFWLGLVVGALGAGVVAISDFFIHGELRAAGHNNAIQFGDIAILFAVMLFAGLSWAKHHSNLMLNVFMLAIASAIFASLLSGARGGWLALLCVLALLYFYSGLYRDRKKALRYAVTIVLGLLVFYQFPQPGLLQARIHDALVDIQQYQATLNSQTSLGARFVLWQTSFDMFRLQPVFGWGSLQAYVQVTPNAPEVLQTFNHMHNDFLDALVKRGVIGAFGLLVIYFIPAYIFYARLSLSSVAAQAAALAGVNLVLATFVCGWTQSFFSHSSGVMVYVFMMIILWGQVRTANEASQS